jgi:hypothetical protein
VVLKSYFDGGNEADSLQYDLVTLAAFSGTKYHWQKFDRRWKKCLKDHGAKYLHTTDAVCLSRDFSRRNGWDEDKVDSLISGCVSAIEECAAVRNGRRLEKASIRPVTISVLLQDFKKALSDMPDLRTPEHLCATQCVPVCALYGKLIGADKLQLFFDQGERFFGHIRDRMDNKKSRVEPLWPCVIHAGESDMRLVPALQAADLLAWSVNHAYEEDTVSHKWQQRILDIDRERECFDYEYLRTASREAMSTVKSWNLPTRRSPR